MSVNNHIHTTYSFSPYTPTQAVEKAHAAGLVTAGIMDHDSISGAREFIEAGERVGIATTIGVECRVKVTGTRLEGRRINNPDQNSVMYMAIHAVPHRHIDDVTEFFKPLVAARNIRNRAIVDNVNRVLGDGASPFIDFDTDVYPLSMAHDGGSITERHIMFAVAKKMTDDIPLQYELLGKLKKDLIPKVYVDATEECIEAGEMIRFAKSINAISAYAYLGDVGDSITGDKRTQTFEDGYLDILFEEINSLGFDAVTYMPSRNTAEQLRRVRELCDKYGFMQICGEDINSPSQPFVCEALSNPEFANLIDAAWELVRRERM